MAHWDKARTALALALAALAIACATRQPQQPAPAAGPADPAAMPAEYHAAHISRDGVRDRLPSEN